MKTNRILILLTGTLLMLSGSVSAVSKQPPGNPAGQRKEMTSKELAAAQTAHMDSFLELTDNQRKKLYKAFLQHNKQSQWSSAGMRQAAGMPSGGGGGGRGMGGSGGGPDGGGGGRPPGGSGGSPDGFGSGSKPMTADEKTAQLEAKMKKILTPEQFTTWKQKEWEALQAKGWSDKKRPQGKPEEKPQGEAQGNSTENTEQPEYPVGKQQTDERLLKESVIEVK